MNCKYCNKEYETGYGTFCSRSCCNKARGPRSKEVRQKIKQSNIEQAAKRDSSYYEKLRKANSSPERLLKVKEAWVAKRDYKVAHVSSIKKWLKEDISACQECGVQEWQGKQLPLEVHHIDGDSSNNIRENLQVLCPNCHALTDNWRGRK